MVRGFEIRVGRGDGTMGDGTPVNVIATYRSEGHVRRGRMQVRRHTTIPGMVVLWKQCKCLPVDALCFRALLEPEVGHTDGEPSDQLSSSREIENPGKDDAGTVPEHHVGEECKARMDPDCDVRQPERVVRMKIFGALPEMARPSEGQCVRHECDH